MAQLNGLASDVPDVDTVLLRNVAKAHKWFEMLKQGQSFAEIAEQEKLSARRVQQLMDHARFANQVRHRVYPGSPWEHIMITSHLKTAVSCSA